MKSTIHWVSAEHAIDAEVRLYETLFTQENPNEVPEGQDFTANLNPNSLEVVDRREAGAEPGGRRAGQPLPVRAAGLFLRRSGLARREKLVFNRTVALRDTWAKIEKKIRR